MRSSWDKLVHNVGTIQGHNISNELQNNNTVIISKPDHTQDVLDEYQLSAKRRDQLYQRLAEVWQFQKGQLEEQVIEGEPKIAAKAKMSLAIINNEFAYSEYKSQHILPIFLGGDAKVEHDKK